MKPIRWETLPKSRCRAAFSSMEGPEQRRAFGGSAGMGVAVVRICRVVFLGDGTL